MIRRRKEGMKDNCQPFAKMLENKMNAVNAQQACGDTETSTFLS